MADVSIATVSKVINNKDENISDKTRQKVLEIAEREGYVPNGVAKSLKSKTTSTIGVIVPDIMNLFFAEMARGIEDAAEKKGYSVILCNTDNDEAKQEKYVRVLQEKMVDGIIFTASEKSNNSFKALKNIPLVLLDRDLKSSDSDRVGKIIVDNTLGGYIATEHLINKGCRNIGLIASKEINKPSGDRIEGYMEALRENGICFREELVYLNNYTVESGYKGVRELFESESPDGIFCANDLIAIGALKALAELEKEVPRDVKLVGYDDIDISKYLNPALTTIKQPIYEMGKEAVNMLISIINKADVSNNRRKIFPIELVERKST